MTTLLKLVSRFLTPVLLLASASSQAYAVWTTIASSSTPTRSAQIWRDGLSFNNQVSSCSAERPVSAVTEFGYTLQTAGGSLARLNFGACSFRMALTINRDWVNPSNLQVLGNENMAGTFYRNLDGYMQVNRVSLGQTTSYFNNRAAQVLPGPGSGTTGVNPNNMANTAAVGHFSIAQMSITNFASPHIQTTIESSFRCPGPVSSGEGVYTGLGGSPTYTAAHVGQITRGIIQYLERVELQSDCPASMAFLP